MPKKVRRGGRYTTGIKRTSTGGYGGQTTGRRGCLSAMLPFLILAAVTAGYLAVGLRPWGA